MTDVQSAGAGHNSEAAMQRILNDGLNKLFGIQEQIDSLVGKKRALRKQLKGDGFKPWEIDYAIRLRKDMDESEGSEESERRQAELRIARFLSHPIGTQFEMFDEADRAPLVDKAYALGKAAGMAGKPASPPYDTGSEAGQAWLRGHGDGSAVLKAAGGDEIIRPMKGDDEPEIDPFDYALTVVETQEPATLSDEPRDEEE